MTIRKKTTVKDVIESAGVPHTEVDLILVNQRTVYFSYHVGPNDRISVYPVFESFDISGVTRVRPAPLRISKFVLDVHLGKLAVYLRFAGFDTRYHNQCDDAELARISAAERRILLTRDRGVLLRKMVTHGYYVRTTHPKSQIEEIFHRFQLSLAHPLKSRCTQCNSELYRIPKEKILDRLLPDTKAHDDEFSHCPLCDRIYWKGTQYDKMLKYLEKITHSP